MHLGTNLTPAGASGKNSEGTGVLEITLIKANAPETIKFRVILLPLSPVAPKTRQERPVSGRALMKESASWFNREVDILLINQGYQKSDDLIL